MNKFGRRFVNTLIIGGTIAFGVAINSTNAFAEEIVTAAPEEVSVSTEDEGEQTTDSTEIDETIQSMEDALGVIEGDAVAEEGYLKQVEDAIADESMTEEKAEEILSAGEVTLEQATEKKEQVESTYAEIVEEAAAVEEDFNNQAKSNGFEECVEAIGNEQDINKKIEIIEAASQNMLSERDGLTKELDENSEEYHNAQSSYEDAKAFLDEYGLYLDVFYKEREYSEQRIKELEESYESLKDYTEHCRHMEDRFYELANADEELKRAKQEAEDAWNSYDNCVGGYQGELIFLEGGIGAFTQQLEEAEARGNQEEIDYCKAKLEELQADLKELLDKESWYAQRANEYKQKAEEATKKCEQLLTDYPELEEFDYASYERATYAAIGAYIDSVLYIPYEIDNLKSTIIFLDESIEYIKEKERIAEESKAIIDNYEQQNLHFDAVTSLVNIASDYKSALVRQSKAKVLLDAANSAYQKVADSYVKLNTVIEYYKYIKPIEDIVSAISDEAIAEEGYLKQIKDAIADNSLTKENEEAIRQEAASIFNLVKDKKEQIENLYKEVAERFKSEREEAEGIQNLNKQLAEVDENSDNYKVIVQTIAYYEQEVQRLKTLIDSEDYKQKVNDLEYNRTGYDFICQEYQTHLERLHECRRELNSLSMNEINEVYEKYLEEYEKLENMEEGPEKQKQHELVSELYWEHYYLYTEYICTLEPLMDEVDYLEGVLEDLERWKNRYSNAIGSLEIEVNQPVSDLSMMETNLAQCLDTKFEYEQQATDIRNKINALEERTGDYQAIIKISNQLEALLEKANTEYQKVADSYEKITAAITAYQEEQANKPVVTEETYNIDKTYDATVEFNFVANINNEVKNIAVKVEQVSVKADATVKTVKENATSAAKKTVDAVVQLAGKVTVSVGNVIFNLKPVLSFALSFFFKA